MKNKKYIYKKKLSQGNHFVYRQTTTTMMTSP